MINHATHSPYFTSVRKISGFRSKLLYVLLRTRGRVLSGFPAARHSPARLRATQSGSGYFGTFVPFARWRIYLMVFNPPLSKIDFCFLVGARGFEPPTFCSQSRRTTRLSTAPFQYILSKNPGEVHCLFGIESGSTHLKNHSFFMLSTVIGVDLSYK